MMTLEDYELRLAVAKVMREHAERISPAAVELADLGLGALNEQWKRAQVQASANQAAEYVAGLAKDSQRLEWMITNRVCFSINTSDEHPGDYCMWQISPINGDLYIMRRTNDPRQAIDKSMKG